MCGTPIPTLLSPPWVAGKISQQEFQAAMREQQDRMRTQLGGKVDPAVFRDSADAACSA
jgi:hypothetical protein